MSKKYLSLLITLLSFTCYTTHTASWRVFVYMDSSDNLSDMAFKNITEMICGTPSDSVEFFIQLHAYDTIGLRYTITKTGLTCVDTILLSESDKQAFIEGARWALEDIKSDTYVMISLWGHGWGILDPEWNSETQQWEADGAYPHEYCALDKNIHMHRRRHKGYIFNAQRRSYINIQDLSDSFSILTQQILNKKIDVVAFDTCMGSMLEVAYELAPYAQYLVGSQSCALRDGFDWQEIVATLNKMPSPRQLVSNMVHIFDAHYQIHDLDGIYTHAALDLSQVGNMQEKINALITLLLLDDRLLPTIHYAKTLAPRFCMWPMYTDLVAFCKHIENQLQDNTILNDAIKHCIHDVVEISEQFVVAHCRGSIIQDMAHGYAIYLPNKRPYASYFSTKFAQESLWSTLLLKLSENLS